MSMKSMPAQYLEGIGWIITVEWYLNPWELKVARDYIYKVNLDRWRCTPPGDKKDLIWRALEDLKLMKIQQSPKKEPDGYPLFKSNQRQNPERSFSFPKGFTGKVTVS